jgi:hypothetical protein
MVYTQGRQTIRRAQQHKQDHGRCSMGEHHEADLKEIKCLRNQALQILKSISYVGQFPTQPLCLSAQGIVGRGQNQSETDRDFSSWPQSTSNFQTRTSESVIRQSIAAGSPNLFTDAASSSCQALHRMPPLHACMHHRPHYS